VTLLLIVNGAALALADGAAAAGVAVGVVPPQAANNEARTPAVPIVAEPASNRRRVSRSRTPVCSGKSCIESLLSDGCE
jgi:hypothetical protein